MKVYAFIITLTGKISNLEINKILHIARLFVRLELEGCDSNSMNYDTIKTPEFVLNNQNNIDKDPKRSMRSVAKELQQLKGLIRISEGIDTVSYI